MIKLDKRLVIIILSMFLLASILGFIFKSESDDFLFAAIYISIFYYKPITKYDYIFVGSFFLEAILKFISIFYRNIYLTNFFAIIMWSLAIFAYIKKSEIRNEKS